MSEDRRNARGRMAGAVLAIGSWLAALALLALYWWATGVAGRRPDRHALSDCPAASAPEPAQDVGRQAKVAAYARKLRAERPDYLAIYELDGRYSVWLTGTGQTKWRDADSLAQARKIVDDYFIEWAENCVGDEPPGRRVE